MTDAELAIIDIQDALSEYGSDIVLTTKTYGAYNPTGTTSETTTTTNTKAFIKKYASETVQESIKNNIDLSTYKMSLTLYYSGSINNGDIATVMGNNHTVIYVYPTILQNTIIKYELLVR